MAFELKMPQLSDTMHSGKIVRWHKQQGEKVRRGDILAEVETDKANLEIESFNEGILLKISVPAGAEAKVGETIAYIGEAQEKVEEVPLDQALAFAQERTSAQEQASPQISAPEEEAISTPHIPSSPERIKASPLARKIAAAHNVDLSTISGSGPDGRIVREDVERAISLKNTRINATPDTPTAAPKTEDVFSPSGVPGKLIPYSKMRAAIARRMQASATQAPHFFTTVAINMEAARDVRETLKRKPEFKGLGINHLIIKAAAYALQREPRINCAAREDYIFVPDQINIGVVTAVEDGLLIPVIHEADKLSLREIVSQARAAIERAKSGKPSATDLSGGTFTISNMGMYEIENFTAIIYPGQGAILSVSAMREEAVAKQGQIVPGLRMRVTLAVDHRIIDGVMSAQYLGYLKEALEHPALLLL